MFPRSLAATLIGILSSSAPGQGTSTCHPADEQYVLHFDHVALELAAKEVGKMTCKEIRVDPSIAQRPITLSSPHLGKLKAKGVEVLFELALVAQHLKVQHDGKVLRISPE